MSGELIDAYGVEISGRGGGRRPLITALGFPVLVGA
jgi:hypothetical protein